jgi:hypothetical protein
MHSIDQQDVWLTFCHRISERHLYLRHSWTRPKWNRWISRDDREINSTMIWLNFSSRSVSSTALLLNV